MEEFHNEIRCLKDGFKMLKDTYKGLILLKDKYKNLRIKACVVYSHYNQDCIEDLFSLLKNDFKDLDRVVFSVVHGSVSNPEAFLFDWGKYFQICEKLRRDTIVKEPWDFHSLFTIALRIAKNDFLKELLKRKDMYKKCGAGKRVIVVNEIGDVFACEPLWEPVGNLRKNNYDMGRILSSEEMKCFKKKVIKERCNCHWGLPLSNTLIYKPKYYPKITYEMMRIALKSLIKTKGRISSLQKCL